MSITDIFASAIKSIQHMATQHGKDHVFTYDKINLPTAFDPSIQRRLIREGYIRKAKPYSSRAQENAAIQYQFGANTLETLRDPNPTTLVSTLRDGRTGCLSLLATMPVEEYLNFIESAYFEREGGVEGQRTPLRTNTATRIRKTMISDLEAGAVLPPVVVGIVINDGVPPNINSINNENFCALLDGTPEENISVIDGMQRTTALMQIREKRDKIQRLMRVEFWLASNTNSLIYRMLVLNTGQVPWDLRRQIEVVHKSLIKELKIKNTSIEVLEKDDQRRRVKPGQFQADRLIELYMVFGARKEKIDTKERLADEFTRLDFIEATSVSQFTLQFFDVIDILFKLDHAFSKYTGTDEPDKFCSGKDLFSSQPACVGFIAAVALHIFGRPGSTERTEAHQNDNLQSLKSQAQALIEIIQVATPAKVGDFLDFTTLNDIIINKKVGKVGDFEREFFLKSFQTLIEEKFSIDTMRPCWRAY